METPEATIMERTNEQQQGGSAGGVRYGRSFAGEWGDAATTAGRCWMQVAERWAAEVCRLVNPRMRFGSGGDARLSMTERDDGLRSD